MYHLSLYIIKKLLFLFFSSIIIISFVMISGIIFKLFNKGATFYNIADILLLISPESLAFSIPLGLLIATMLTYSRLSSDSELVAMYSAGINIWQIIFPPLLFSILVTLFCFFLQFYIIPNAKYELKTKLRSIGLENPSLFIIPGETVEIFHNQHIYVDTKNGNQLTGILIKTFDSKQRITQSISAKSGAISYNKDKHIIDIPLEDITVINYKYDKSNFPSIIRIKAKKWEFSHHFIGGVVQQSLIKRAKYLDLGGLLARHRIINNDSSKKTQEEFLIFQIHKKAALALAPLALIMISLAFGLKIGRREASHSLLLITALALIYFIAVAIAESILRKNAFAANICIWLPNISYQIIGLFNIKKVSST